MAYHVDMHRKLTSPFSLSSSVAAHIIVTQEQWKRSLDSERFDTA